jgi:hypothetical protein
VAEHPLVAREFIVGQLARDEAALGVAGIVAANFGQGGAEGGGEFAQGFVLLRREVPLLPLRALHDTAHRGVAGGMAREIGR